MVVSLLIALIYKNKLALWANNKPTYFYNKKRIKRNTKPTLVIALEGQLKLALS